MPKKLSLTQHLSTQELLDRYRNAKNVILKSRYQVIWLLSTDKTPKQVAEMTAYSQTWIYQLKLPEGLDLFFLPAHSPELQPAERLWPLTNEVIANYTPPSLCELEELLMIRCQKLLKQQDLVKGLTCYHWWPMTRAV